MAIEYIERIDHHIGRDDERIKGGPGYFVDSRSRPLFCKYSAFPSSRQQLPRDSAKLSGQASLLSANAPTSRRNFHPLEVGWDLEVGAELCVSSLAKVQDVLTPTFSIAPRFQKVSHYPSCARQSRRRTQSQTTNLAFIPHIAYQLMYRGLRVMKKNPLL